MVPPAAAIAVHLKMGWEMAYRVQSDMLQVQMRIELFRKSIKRFRMTAVHWKICLACL